MEVLSPEPLDCQKIPIQVVLRKKKTKTWVQILTPATYYVTLKKEYLISLNLRLLIYKMGSNIQVTR